MPKENQSFPDTPSVAMALTPSYPVYCVRPEVLQKNARRFVTQFHGTVLYAIKCNPHPLVLKALYDGGIRHFDTASLPEIARIRETFHEAEAYFMHPVKGRAVIRSADGVKCFHELNVLIREDRSRVDPKLAILYSWKDGLFTGSQ